MRTLTVVETSHVAGGDSDSLDEVVVSATRLKPQSLDLQSLQDHLDRQMGLQHWYFYGGGGGGGGGGDESGLGDTIKGYPVDHHSSKDSLDYGPEWQKILKEMSALERAAFASALSSHAKTAGAIDEDGVKEFLNQLAHAVLSNAPGWARDASSRATQNLTQGELGMFEVFVTAAYASAASLPGGI
jgi:hypothetical protein